MLISIPGCKFGVAPRVSFVFGRSFDFLINFYLFSRSFIISCFSLSFIISCFSVQKDQRFPTESGRLSGTYFSISEKVSFGNYSLVGIQCFSFFHPIGETSSIGFTRYCGTARCARDFVVKKDKKRNKHIFSIISFSIFRLKFSYPSMKPLHLRSKARGFFDFILFLRRRG